MPVAVVAMALDAIEAGAAKLAPRGSVALALGMAPEARFLPGDQHLAVIERRGGEDIRRRQRGRIGAGMAFAARPGPVGGVIEAGLLKPHHLDPARPNPKPSLLGSAVAGEGRDEAPLGGEGDRVDLMALLTHPADQQPTRVDSRTDFVEARRIARGLGDVRQWEGALPWRNAIGGSMQRRDGAGLEVAADRAGIEAVGKLGGDDNACVRGRPGVREGGRVCAGVGGELVAGAAVALKLHWQSDRAGRPAGKEGADGAKIPQRNVEREIGGELVAGGTVQLHQIGLRDAGREVAGPVGGGEAVIGPGHLVGTIAGAERQPGAQVAAVGKLHPPRVGSERLKRRMMVGIEAGDGGEDGRRLPHGGDGVGGDVAVAGGAGRVGDPADVGLTAAVIDMAGGAGTDLRRHLPQAVGGQRVALLALRRMRRAPGDDLLLPAPLADR